MADDEEDEGAGHMYEEGHWIWDDMSEQLVFVSDRPQEDLEQIQLPTKAPTGAIEFREQIDLIEQLKYRRRYQRKLGPGQQDIVTLQDVKDIAIYTAPISILSSTLINMLHLPTTERFMKALIFCMQYYLQVSEEMTRRTIDLQSTLRTPLCDVVEEEFTSNLNDLRVLVAKEYCTLLIGGGDLRKYHHMGAAKRRSLSDKDARLFETLLRMFVQIVWLALGRRAFNQLELEINRLFKSEIFNAVEHRLKTNYVVNMSKEEKRVLLGPCLRRGKKLSTESPLMNEVTCDREIDFRVMTIGVIKVKHASYRVHYMHAIIAAPEEKLVEMGLTLGIIGMKRAVFDAMLLPVPTAGKKQQKSSYSVSSMKSNVSNVGSKKSSMTSQPLYPDIDLPRVSKLAYEKDFPVTFPSQPEKPHPCNDVQRRRWLNRLYRMLNTHAGRQQTKHRTA